MFGSALTASQSVFLNLCYSCSLNLYFIYFCDLKFNVWIYNVTLCDLVLKPVRCCSMEGTIIMVIQIHQHVNKHATYSLKKQMSFLNISERREYYHTYINSHLRAPHIVIASCTFISTLKSFIYT